jgi:hypothetical protein
LKTRKDRIELLEGDTECVAWPLTRGECGALILESEISTITCTIRDEETGTIINSRNAQNVKDANNGTLTNGEFEMAFQAADTALQTATQSKEVHVCEIKLTATDAQVRTHIVELVCHRRQTAS